MPKLHDGRHYTTRAIRTGSDIKRVDIGGITVGYLTKKFYRRPGQISQVVYKIADPEKGTFEPREFQRQGDLVLELERRKAGVDG